VADDLIRAVIADSRDAAQRRALIAVLDLVGTWKTSKDRLAAAAEVRSVIVDALAPRREG